MVISMQKKNPHCANDYNSAERARAIADKSDVFLSMRAFVWRAVFYEH